MDEIDKIKNIKRVLLIGSIAYIVAVIYGLYKALLAEHTSAIGVMIFIIIYFSIAAVASILIKQTTVLTKTSGYVRNLFGYGPFGFVNVYKRLSEIQNKLERMENGERVLDFRD